MLNLFRNVSQKIVKPQLSSNPLNKSIDKTVTRHSSILCKTHNSANQDRLQWNQPPLHRIQLPHLRSSSYSTDSEKPNEDAGDGKGEKVQRTLPKLVNQKIDCGPPFFAFIKNRLKTMQIRQSLDPEFKLDEFVEGSKKAVEVVSDKLAMADFDGLQGLVKDEVIESLRDPIVSMTDAQRSEIRVTESDMVKQFVSQIEFTEARGSVFVDISMVYHVVRDFQRLTSENQITPSEFIKQSSKFLDENFFILNYKFTKEFAGDSSGDWIVTYINHVNISDEMMEQTKGIEEMMQKNWKNFQDEKKQKK